MATNSVAIQGQDFTFDAVADAASTQEDLFKLVGQPLVENCLSGFNSSIFAYGQTGSGKTYTMWGPLSAISGDSMGCERGLTPRVFEQLFSRIKEETQRQELIYNCTCSFLEIYNEQITDLLDPMQKNLQIREDVKTACVYVESLTKEFVFTMKDVTQLLVKGLANRRTGSTSANADSSRSHCVFTCVIKSESKNLEDGSNSIRVSRINLLTFLLQESLGGNAMLAMICAVYASERCKSETLSTLRFAQRAKAIKNNAVVNEQKEDDVNALHEQIRHLKDELHRMKSNGGSKESNGNFSTGWNARRSLHLLKMSLNRPTTFQAIKEDSDEEMEIEENDVEKPSNHDNMAISLAGYIGFKRLPASEVTNADKILMPTKRSCSDANKLGEDRCNLNLAACIQRGLQVIESHQNNGAWRRASVGLNARIRDVLPCKVDVATQTDPEESQAEITLWLYKDPDACRDLQLVPADGAVPSDDLKQRQILKLVKLAGALFLNCVCIGCGECLAGSIRREMARDEQCLKQAVEIQQLNRLVSATVQAWPRVQCCNCTNNGNKIARLESLMDGTLPTDEFIHESTNPSPGTKDDDGDANIADAADCAEAESKWIALMDELRADLEANKSLVRRKILDGVEDVKIRAAKAGVKEQETEKAYQEIDNKKNYDHEIIALNQCLTECSKHNNATSLPATSSILDSAPRYDTVGGSPVIISNGRGGGRLTPARITGGHQEHRPQLVVLRVRQMQHLMMPSLFILCLPWEERVSGSSMLYTL
ncbi:hypothetical protein ZWY2020_008883 [Hordeum vulgare]|nr:hypothetical protein ZWY2020_008883 [Hordeum vulgare]